MPTWNYQAVHVHGDIAFQHDERAKRAAVGLLTRDHERRVNGDRAWRMADAPADYMTQMLASIVAFRITVRRVLAKSKLSQNREPRDYEGAVKGLRASGNDALAERMAGRIVGLAEAFFEPIAARRLLGMGRSRVASEGPSHYATTRHHPAGAAHGATAQPAPVLRCEVLPEHMPARRSARIV